MIEDGAHLSEKIIKLLSDILVDRSPLFLHSLGLRRWLCKKIFLRNPILLVRLVNLQAFSCKPRMS